MISYGLLLLLWIILPDFLKTESGPPTGAQYMHRWLIAICIPAFLYYCNFFNFGIFKTLYGRTFRIGIGMSLTWAFTFLKGFELIRISGESAVNHYFDLIFLLSFPLGDALWQFAGEFTKRVNSPASVSRTSTARKTETLILQEENAEVM
jgi:hypothetical protein